MRPSPEISLMGGATTFRETVTIVPMNGQVLHLARRLQAMLEDVDPQKDRDTLVWAHGLLTGLVDHIQNRIPELAKSASALKTTSDLREESKQILAELKSVETGFKDDRGSDSLDEIEREMEGPDDAPVPSKRKPGPKGLSGGTAVPLPDRNLQ
jgi:hypothetical protein